MNYDQPRKRESSGRWDMTSKNGDHVWPIGYCRPWREIADYAGIAAHLLPSLQLGIEEDRPHRERFHSDGHATADEARACYVEWMLDHTMEVVFSRPEDCMICEEITTYGLKVVGTIGAHALCPTHRNREGLRPLLRADSIHS